MITKPVLLISGVLLTILLGIVAIVVCWSVVASPLTPAREDAFTSHPVSKVRPNTTLLETEEIVPENFNSFRFVRYDAKKFIDELTITSTGEGVYRFVDFSDPELRVMQTPIFANQHEIKQLCMILRHAEFCSLEDSYEADVPIDCWMEISIESNGVRKDVACYEHFPDRFTQVVNYLNNTFVPGFGIQQKMFSPMREHDANQWKHFMIGTDLPDDWAIKKETLDHKPSDSY